MKLTSIRIDMPKDEVTALMTVLAKGGAQNVTLQAGESRRSAGNIYGQVIFGLDIPESNCTECGK